MASYYFDTSALAKRYVVEVGSSWVQSIVAHQSGQTLYTSVLTQPELVSALQRRVREGNLETEEALALAEQVVAHMNPRRILKRMSLRPSNSGDQIGRGETPRLAWARSRGRSARQ
jgi:predicted nucleic acid-binding protein